MTVIETNCLIINIGVLYNSYSVLLRYIINTVSTHFILSLKLILYLIILVNAGLASSSIFWLRSITWPNSNNHSYFFLHNKVLSLCFTSVLYGGILLIITGAPHNQVNSGNSGINSLVGY